MAGAFHRLRRARRRRWGERRRGLGARDSARMTAPGAPLEYETLSRAGRKAKRGNRKWTWTRILASIRPTSWFLRLTAEREEEHDPRHSRHRDRRPRRRGRGCAIQRRSHLLRQ